MISSGNISNFINFDFNTAILCNVSFFSYSKPVNNLGIGFLASNKSSNNSLSLFSAFSFNAFISCNLSFANILNSLSFSMESYSYDFQKNYIFLLKLLNLLHLTFPTYRLFHHLTYLTFFLFHFLFHLCLALLISLVFFTSFNIFFKPFILSLIFLIIINFFESILRKRFFGLFEKITVWFDLVKKICICLLLIQQSCIQQVVVFQKVN